MADEVLALLGLDGASSASPDTPLIKTKMRRLSGSKRKRSKSKDEQLRKKRKLSLDIIYCLRCIELYFVLITGSDSSKVKKRKLVAKIK